MWLPNISGEDLHRIGQNLKSKGFVGIWKGSTKTGVGAGNGSLWVLGL